MFCDSGYEPYPLVVYNAPVCYPDFNRPKRYSTGSLVSKKKIRLAPIIKIASFRVALQIFVQLYLRWLHNVDVKPIFLQTKQYSLKKKYHMVISGWKIQYFLCEWKKCILIFFIELSEDDYIENRFDSRNVRILELQPLPR